MKCNIWKCNCEVVLFHGEQLCPWCKGQGGKFENVSFKRRKFTVRRCIMCKGEGKVDWIEAITQRAKPDYTHRSCKDIKMRCTGPDHCKKKLLRLFKQRENKNIGPNWKQVY